MQDNELDDLIIDNISPKNSNTKSFLTVLGMAIVVLIIAIILTKIILKDPNEDSLIGENNAELISPDLTLQSVTQEVVDKPLIPTSETIKPEVNVSAPTVDTSTKEVIPPVKTITQTPKVETVKISNEFATEEANKEKVTIAKEKEAEAKLLKERQAKALAQKEEALKQEQARIAEEKAKQAVDSKEIHHPYFIQVGSFAKTPSTRFLSVIKSSGFNYQITAPASNGIKKLLIGPYATKTKADYALVKVKDRINKSAYIIRK